MIAFDFTCYEPRMSFSDNFHLSGKADESGWNDYGSWPGHDVPGLRGLDINWHVETERSVFDYYIHVLDIMRRDFIPRTPDYVEFWRPSRAMLWISEPDSCQSPSLHRLEKDSRPSWPR